DIEVIIINDGSTDNTAEIIEKYSKIDNRIKIVNKYNSGVSDSRNVGIEMFTGDYVFFLDSDDWVEKDYIIKAVDVLEKN
ncbi:glycosyltransferase family 2 protein, partial [Veillonella parvula]